MLARVSVNLKPSILDPQGKTVKSALESLGFKGIKNVRVGKLIEVEMNHGKATTAKKDVERMCQKLLANPVVETYRVDVKKGK